MFGNKEVIQMTKNIYANVDKDIEFLFQPSKEKPSTEKKLIPTKTLNLVDYNYLIQTRILDDN